MKGIIFDLDGTLVDSLSHWVNLNLEFFSLLKLEPDYKIFEAFKYLSLSEAATLVREKYSLKHSPEEIVDLWFKMANDMYTNKVKLKPYVYEYLHSLKEKNIAFGVATATFNSLAVTCLKSNNVLELFDFVIDVNTYKTTKQSPDIYITAANLLKLPINQCIVFEDSPFAAKTAKNAGFCVYGIADKHWDTNKEELASFSDKIISDYKELLN